MDWSLPSLLVKKGLPLRTVHVGEEALPTVVQITCVSQGTHHHQGRRQLRKKRESRENRVRGCGLKRMKASPRGPRPNKILIDKAVYNFQASRLSMGPR